MFKKYYNKMIGREEYNIKLILIPTMFQRKLHLLLNSPKDATFDARKKRLIDSMVTFHNAYKKSPRKKEHADEFKKYITYSIKALGKKK